MVIMTMTMYCALRAVGSSSNGPSAPKGAFSGESIGYDDESRLQNSPYFCVFKYTRAVKQKVWNEAENRERDLARDVSHVRLLRHALPIS